MGGAGVMEKCQTPKKGSSNSSSRKRGSGKSKSNRRKEAEPESISRDGGLGGDVAEESGSATYDKYGKKYGAWRCDQCRQDERSQYTRWDQFLCRHCDDHWDHGMHKALK